MTRQQTPTHLQAFTRASGFPVGSPAQAGQAAGLAVREPALRALVAGQELLESLLNLLQGAEQRLQLSDLSTLSLEGDIKDMRRLLRMYHKAVNAGDQEEVNFLSKALTATGLGLIRIATLVRTEAYLQLKLKEGSSGDTEVLLERLEQAMRELMALREDKDA